MAYDVPIHSKDRFQVAAFLGRPVHAMEIEIQPCNPCVNSQQINSSFIHSFIRFIRLSTLFFDKVKKEQRSHRL